jgi:hypothetical protein
MAMRQLKFSWSDGLDDPENVHISSAPRQVTAAWVLFAMSIGAGDSPPPKHIVPSS